MPGRGLSRVEKPRSCPFAADQVDPHRVLVHLQKKMLGLHRLHRFRFPFIHRQISLQLPFKKTEAWKGAGQRSKGGQSGREALSEAQDPALASNQQPGNRTSVTTTYGSTCPRTFFDDVRATVFRRTVLDDRVATK